jgi:hypothetical protein
MVKDHTKFIVLALIDVKIDGRLPVCLYEKKKII